MIAKQRRLLLAVLCGTLSGGIQAATISPQIIISPVDKGFVPLGFDDNDNAEVIVHGEFPDACYKTGPVSVTIDSGSKTITVDARSYRYSGTCAQVQTPFIQVAKIGLLPKGDYKVVVFDRPQVEMSYLNVKESNRSGPDDFLYAPVETISLETTADGQKYFKVEGTFPYMFIGCMLMSEVRVQRTPGEVLIVLPIARITNDESECATQDPSHHFEVLAPLPDVESGEYLAHVRVLAGNSVNRLFSISR